MTRLAGGIALVLACLSACLAQFPVTGRIVDGIEGKPVANAQVGLLGDAAPPLPTARTDAEGKFAFSVPAGTYKLAVEKAGFFPFPNDPVEVREGTPGNLALVLTRVRSITAHLVWPDGEPLTRALVWMGWRNGQPLNVAEGRAQASTDKLYFSNLAAGTIYPLDRPELRSEYRPHWRLDGVSLSGSRRARRDNRPKVHGYAGSRGISR